MITTNAFDYINVLDKAADASWLRETAIMNNLANTNTPGYKRQEVDFESVLQRELGHSKYTTLDKKIRSLCGSFRSECIYLYRLIKLFLPSGPEQRGSGYRECGTGIGDNPLSGTYEQHYL